MFIFSQLNWNGLFVILCDIHVVSSKVVYFDKLLEISYEWYTHNKSALLRASKQFFLLTYLLENVLFRMSLGTVVYSVVKDIYIQRPFMS